MTRLFIGLVVVMAVVGSVAASVALRRSHSPKAPTNTVSAVLDQRADAILHRDRSAFEATLDPTDPTLRRTQLAVFTNLAEVPLASWSYRQGRGHSVTLRYQFAGFDAQPILRVQHPTFVERDGRWYVRSWPSQTGADLWDFGPVAAVHRPSVLVLGAPAQRRRLANIAALMTAAIPRVNAVWRSSWPHRAVVLVPTSEHEMSQVDDSGDHSDLRQIAAQTGTDGQVTINPVVWPQLGGLGRSIVLTHELTHVATRSVSGPQTPRWLEEGFADYVGFRQPGVTVNKAAAELATAVRAGHLPVSLPADSDFRWGGPRLAAVYEQAWLACRYIVVTKGQPALVRFYRAVGTSPQGSSAAVATALHRFLGLTMAQFTARWRGYVRRELVG